MSSLRRACLCLLLRYYIRADDLDEEDLFDLDGEGDYEDPESYIEYDQALYYDGPDDYYDGIEQFNICLLYTSPSPRDQRGSRMPSSA